MTTILIIEDEVNLNKILSDYLRHNGFLPISTHTGKEGLTQWQEARPDLILLDLNLPDMDGLDVARTLRKSSQTPIIMVTARQEELDKLIGLELGADDYISKPFSPREVVARVKAVLRRCKGQNDNEEIIRLGEISIDLDSHTVELKGVKLDLTPAEFNLLFQLACRPGKVFTRLELLQATQGTCYKGYERTIDVHIMNLRQKIRQIDPERCYIQTVFGQGYRAVG
ncbi:MAG TPA: response regulator transcription factor [Anaerolineaceae bacterium]|nr:response regulator transcription factor [Anaerolineaceae bacterium]